MPFQDNATPLNVKGLVQPKDLTSQNNKMHKGLEDPFQTHQLVDEELRHRYAIILIPVTPGESREPSIGNKFI